MKNGMTRQERKKQLLNWWKTKEGRDEVLRLFYQVLGPDGRATAGMRIFDVILDHEYGPEPDATTSAENPVEHAHANHEDG